MSPARCLRAASATLAVGLLLFGTQFGCQAPQPPTARSEVVLDIPDYDRFIDETLTVLRETDFQPRVVDRTHGVIQTSRTTGAQWFEFWRNDVHGGYQLLESSIATFGRSVTINISPASGQSDPQSVDPAAQPAVVTEVAPAASAPTTQEYADPPLRSGKFVVGVQVDKYRLSQPDRQITTTAGAIAMFNERNPTTEGLRGKASRTNYWIPAGRDGLCEDYLLKRILKADPQATPVNGG